MGLFCKNRPACGIDFKAPLILRDLKGKYSEICFSVSRNSELEAGFEQRFETNETQTLIKYLGKVELKSQNI